MLHFQEAAHCWYTPYPTSHAVHDSSSLHSSGDPTAGIIYHLQYLLASSVNSVANPSLVRLPLISSCQTLRSLWAAKSDKCIHSVFSSLSCAVCPPYIFTVKYHVWNLGQDNGQTKITSDPPLLNPWGWFTVSNWNTNSTGHISTKNFG